ncbi:MAG: class I SAM-dependent methyltransferase [Treponema sp.]|nr:class I SAM-dependent methyltransferase [Treponema sp.]
MEADKYSNIAETYDYMLFENTERENFFVKIFDQYKVKSILDCACGTGKDLVFFNSLKYDITGSDISDSMLSMAQKRIEENGLNIPLFKADYQFLENTFTAKFDAIVCLSNAINDTETDVEKALNSMKNVLNNQGIIIFDQGQTDISMQNPPCHSLEVNNKDFSRLFTMDYKMDIMTIKIFDLVHTDSLKDFRINEFKFKIRLYDDWIKILNKVNLHGDYYGNWDSVSYDKQNSRRLIIVAKKK